MLPQTTDVQGASRIAHCSPRRILNAIRAGDLDAVRIGRAYVIPAKALANWINAAARAASRDKRASR
jgi:hypothetical protein